MIQKNYGVLPTVVSAGDWQTKSTLDSLAGISSALIDDPDMRPARIRRITPWSDYSGFYGRLISLTPPMRSACMNRRRSTEER